MDFASLLRTIDHEPVFETGLLLSGSVDPMDVRKQLSRWTAAGKIIQLRRSLYCLAPPYQKAFPHPFLIANRLMPASYVSLQSALAHYGLIPEGVPLTTSVTSCHPGRYSLALGQYDFRHIQVGWFHSYHRVDLGGNQEAFIATPEKALLDLVYLQAGGDSDDFLRSLRLQSLERLDLAALEHLVITSGKRKLDRAAAVIRRLVEEEARDFQSL